MNHRGKWSVFFILCMTALFILAFTETEGLQGNPSRTSTPPASDDWIVARIYFSDRSVLNRLAEYLDIFEVHHPEKYIVAMLSPEQYQNLQTKGLRLEMDPIYTREVNRAPQAARSKTEVVPSLPCYRTVEEIYASMSQLESQYPGIVSWIDVGDSWEKWSSGGTNGYDLKVLVLTNKAKPAAGKFKFFLMGAIHAREMAAGETAARFAEVLAGEYGRNPDITWILDYGEVHILPLANPDGRKWAEKGYWQRKNTDTNGGACSIPPLPSWNTQTGTDLNRNSDSHWGEAGSSNNPCDDTYRGSTAASEPETKVIQDYIAAIFPDQRGPNIADPAPPTATGLFITLHSFGNLVLYPWGWTDQQVPNQSALQTLGRKFSFFNHYTVQQAYWLYLTSGTTDDWVYDYLGVASYTFEVGTTFFEECPTFENVIWRDNLAALLYAAKAARTPYQTPSGPEMINVYTDKQAVIAGTRVYLNAIGSDTRFYGGAEPSQPIQGARYSVDASSWTPGAVLLPMVARDESFNSTEEVVEAWIDTTGWTPGRHILLLEGQDANGIWGPPTAVFLDILDAYRFWLPIIQN